MKKITTSICIAFVLAGLSGCKNAEIETQEQIVRPIRTMIVQQPEALEQGSIAGKARAAQSVELSFRVGGPLVERPIYVGDIVEKGALVAKIDPTDFEIEVIQAHAGFEQAKARLVRAEGDYRRIIDILKADPGFTSEATVDLRREALASAQANVKLAKAALRTAENQLSYTELKSPIAGKVVTTYVENFETVQPKQRIVRILDNSRIKFDIDVPSQDIFYVDFVSDIVVEFDDLPGLKIPAVISEIATEASETTKTYRVTLLLEQPQEGEILAGMAGKAYVTVDTGEKQENIALRVPTSAVFSPELGKKSYVWVVDTQSMIVSKREVQVSNVAELGAEILSGIKPGETIAIAGVHFLTKGSKVRLIDSPQAAL